MTNSPFGKLRRLTWAYNYGDTALTENFAYSVNGNMLSRTRNPGAYSYPPNGAARPHAPIAVGARAYGYDANGNMLGDGLKTLTWANDNRLSRVTLGSNVSSFAYGPDGSRSHKTVTGPPALATRYFGAKSLPCLGTAAPHHVIAGHDRADRSSSFFPQNQTHH